ncbi:MAG: UDP-glucose 4-epimerase GalE [Caldimicrobium thiodismutans]|uniref:UDP-glucose 4-epimerase n=1 Tax=Caldimicrobium thiodismutans TaxID=1653476 RepID=A0A2N7PIB4_9BACT|nr:MAG: UDP-glucose 4-epimerase GalE [Caldimicrobium thiodismutans]
MKRKSPFRVVVTGGAGYIGSHVVKLLVREGHEVLVIDNLSTTSGENLKYGRLAIVDLSEEEKVFNLLKDFKPQVVIHFAAFIVVPESVEKPLKYYYNNVGNTLRLLSAMKRAGIENLIFSSSAAVYGIPERVPVTEEDPLKPISPYGESKAMVEKILRDMDLAGEIKYISLRYFNVAGADPEGELGPTYHQPSHLIIRALKAAKGELPFLEIYGTDYPTPDGTCIRDYIHVTDLAKAHLLAMEYLVREGESQVLNCGYGRGYSVKEVIETVRKITGVNFEVREGKRRPGDPPVLIASNKKIKEILGFKPEFEDLEIIIKHTWEFEKRR